MSRHLNRYCIALLVIGAIPMTIGAQDVEAGRAAVANSSGAHHAAPTDGRRVLAETRVRDGCRDVRASVNPGSSSATADTICPEVRMSENGLVTIASKHSVHETIDRLVSILEEKGFTIFARIDHARNAAGVGMELRPTELLIFGNPKVGSLLMQDRQTVGLDLPVKMLAWEDADSRVWLTYTDAAWMGERHGLGEKGGAGVQKMGAVLAEVSKAAAGG